MKNKKKEVRQCRKLTQGKLAEKIGIARPYLSEIERCLSMPTITIASKLSNALNIPLDELFFVESVHNSIQNLNQLEEAKV